jgi:hypothetical protein
MDSFENEPILNGSKCGLLDISLCNLEVSGANMKKEAVCFSSKPICPNNPEDHDTNVHHLGLHVQ